MTSNICFTDELRILCPELKGTNETCDSNDVVELASHGKYAECLKLCCSRIPCLNFISLADVQSLGTSLTKYLADCDTSDERYERELNALCATVSCLQLFVISNWTGPFPTDVSSIFTNLEPDQIKNDVHALLEMNGETIYPLVNCPLLLYIVKVAFDHIILFQKCRTASWWFLRYISIHQQLLGDRAPILHELSESAIASISKEDFLSDEGTRSYAIQLHLEIGLLRLFYYQYKDAEKHFDTATDIAGLECNLDGALGVRTRFQQKPVAQLRVRINKTKQEALHSKSVAISENDIPKALSLNDDTLLETVSFSDENEAPNPDMTAEEHAIVLMMCTNMQKTSPSHKLRDEQILCVMELLLSEPKCWAVHVEALRVRSHLQRSKSRTVERSMMQFEALVKNLSPKPSSENDNSDIPLKRLTLFYSIWPKPQWILQKQLAKLFESLGARSSSLEIYRRLHMWEEAILCLIRTGRGHEAETLIREQLLIKEDPNLLCLLGDILQDESYYEKAWEVSNQHSSRAMRSLAAFKVSKKQHSEAIACFEKSLKINYLQVAVWFQMGCAALACEDYEKAAKSFQKCVSLNWDNFEAWGNLSVSFVRCNKKNQAFKALQEAIGCNFDRWQLWENLLFVSADVGQFNEVIRSYNRLLDLKDKYLDTSVLRVLVRAVVEDLPDAKEQASSRLRPEVLKLFGRLTSKTTSNWEVWSLYARLLGDAIGNNPDDNDRALSYLQKALRSGMQQPSWEKDIKLSKKLTDVSLNLIAACVHCWRKQENKLEQIESRVTAIKLSLNGMLAKLKMQERQLLSEEAKREYVQLFTALDEKIVSMNSLLQQNS